MSFIATIANSSECFCCRADLIFIKKKVKEIKFQEGTHWEFNAFYKIV